MDATNVTSTPSAQKSAPAAKPKVRGRPFKKGQSGNPGGRPKGLSSAIRESVPAEKLAAYFQAIWTRDEKALKKLGIALSEVTLAERTKAGDWLADRGYGKAPSYQPIEGGDPLELGDVDRAITATVDELAGRREAQATRGAEGGALAAEG